MPCPPRRLFLENAALRNHVLAFTNCFFEQVTQNLLCNRLHAIEQRLAKWLLTSATASTATSSI